MPSIVHLQQDTSRDLPGFYVRMIVCMDGFFGNMAVWFSFFFFFFPFAIVLYLLVVKAGCSITTESTDKGSLVP